MWTQMPGVAGIQPRPSNCHSLTLVGQRLFVAGGFSEPPEPPVMPLAALDLDVSGWQHPATCVGARGFLLPCPRYAHSAVAFSDAFLVVFGGYGMGHWLNDLWLADVRADSSGAPGTSSLAVATTAGAAGQSHPSSAASTSRRASHAPPAQGGSGWPSLVTWHATAPGGPQPPPRAAHSAVVCDGSMVIYGGNDGSRLFDDSWMLSVRLSAPAPIAHVSQLPPSRLAQLTDALLEWRPVDYLGTPPSPRSGHSCVLHGSEMLVFGGGEGWGGHCFNDLHSGHVDVKSGSIVWVRPSSTGTPPPPRSGHSASLVGERMFVFGGGDARRALNDLHVLDLAAMAWSRPSDTGVLPPPRGGHAAAAVGTLIAVFGGASPDGHGFNDLHLLDTAYSPYDAMDDVGAGGSLREDGAVPSASSTAAATGAAPFHGAGGDADGVSEAEQAMPSLLMTQSDNEVRTSRRVTVSGRVAPSGGGVAGPPPVRPVALSLDRLALGAAVSRPVAIGRRAAPPASPGSHLGPFSSTPPALLGVATESVAGGGGASVLPDHQNPIRALAVSLRGALAPAVVPESAAQGRSPAAAVATPVISPPPAKTALLARVAALQRADDERYAQLSGQLERWRDERRAELDAFREQMLAELA